MFDTNVFGRLLANIELMSEIDDLVQTKKVKILLCRSVAEELPKEILSKALNLLKFDYIGNTVGRTGILHAGDSIGPGIVFDKSRGRRSKSRKINDDLIIDAASWHADWIVSGDGKFPEKVRKSGAKCRLLDLEFFSVEIHRLHQEHQSQFSEAKPD